MIRFLETRFGVHEPNISAWRRAVCGDLTSCFDFAAPDHRTFVAQLPPTRAAPDRAAKLEEVAPPLPPTLVAPLQKNGFRRRRAVPYRLEAHLAPGADAAPAVLMHNRSAERAAVFHVYRMDRLDRPPGRFTVAASGSLTTPLASAAGASHDLFLLGPAGFHRRFVGHGANLTARIIPRLDGARLHIANFGTTAVTWSVTDLAYGGAERAGRLAAGDDAEIMLDLVGSHGWYDLLLAHGDDRHRLAGHVETDRPSLSDPAAHGFGTLQTATK